MEAGDMKLQTDTGHLSLRDGFDALQIKAGLNFFQRSNDAVKRQPIICFCFTISTVLSGLLFQPL